MPSFKLVAKYRDGANISKKQDQPKTSWQRILESPHIPAATKQRLQQQFQQLNPIELYHHMDCKIKAIIKQVND